jgi:hypothetical protein
MLALTFAGGVAMALLYVVPPLLILAILSPTALSGTWFWAAIGIAALVFWVALFTLALRESAADQRYAEQL